MSQYTRIDNYIERNDVAMTTVYAGDHYEKNVTAGEAMRYYCFAGQRIAMRVQSDANATGVVTWLHGDMLGSASVATDANGNKIAGSDPSTSSGRYMPFGEVRSGFAGSGLPTDRRFIPQLAALTRDVPQGRSVLPATQPFLAADKATFLPMTCARHCWYCV